MSVQQWIDEAEAAALRQREVGVSSPEVLRGRSGLDFLRAIIAGELPGPPIGRVLNFRPIRAEAGRVMFQGEPTADFYNPIGSVHGGWAATLLDSCMACAVQSTLAAGRGYTTVELKVNLVRALSTDTGPVRAEGWVVHGGRQIATAEGRLTGADGKLYAHGSTTCLVVAL
jgi:uncharacterized protein (TIGR00369 family)